MAVGEKEHAVEGVKGGLFWDELPAEEKIPFVVPGERHSAVAPVIAGKPSADLRYKPSVHSNGQTPSAWWGGGRIRPFTTFPLPQHRPLYVRLDLSMLPRHHGNPCSMTRMESLLTALASRTSYSGIGGIPKLENLGFPSDLYQTPQIRFPPPAF